MEKTTFSIAIDKILAQKIGQQADTEHRSRNNLINKIIWDYYYKQIDNKKSMDDK